MHLVLTHAGLAKIANALMNNESAFEAVKFLLYTDSITPDADFELGDINRPSNGGYSDWTPGTATGSEAGGEASWTWGSHTFTFTAGGPTETVRGAGLWDDSSGTDTLIALGNLDTPYPVPGGGGSLELTFNGLFRPATP